MIYAAKPGDTITDAVLNSTGLISNWSSVLDANNFDTWTPDIGGTNVVIPDSSINDLEAIRALVNSPVSNSSSSGIYSLISQIFQNLLSALPAVAPVIPPSVQDLNTYFKVGFGQTITDVILNATGNIQNWAAILDANNFDWTPQLAAGQMVAIPPTVAMDLNAARSLDSYPVDNNSNSDIYNQVTSIFDVMGGSNDWILITSFWNDFGHWYDTSFWQD